MSIGFLTPAAALIAAGVLLPLTALVAVSRRATRLRRALGVPQPPRRRLGVPLLGTFAAAALLGLAAAQPVLERTTPKRVRLDAEAYLVLDISRSMLARESGSPTRFARAKAAAAQIRAELPGIPVGIASLTDRLLPHVFPTTDEDVFAAALHRSIGILRPPQRARFYSLGTSLDSLNALATRGYFSPAATQRLVVVLSDGESQPVNADRIRRLFARQPPIRTVFVQFWDEDERVYTNGVAEPQYRPDPAAPAVLRSVALAMGAEAYGEDETGEAADRSRELLGSGPTRTEGRRRNPVALAPFLTLAAFLPLSLVLVRRSR
jgi:hypothetical protein